MTPRDFCYWLQGRFELGGCTPAPVTAAQAIIIQKHLALTMNQPGVGHNFCQWLDGLFAGIDCSEGMNDGVVAKVRTKLNAAFLQEIDPTFINQKELSAIHDGTGQPIQAAPAADDSHPRPRC